MTALNFEGSGSEYFKIWIVNILLVILTIGLYYPWAKVRNRRYFYGNTTLHGRNFEYHATGKQLFLGYLVAMLLFITYVLVSKASPVGSLIIPLALLVAIPWLIWRSLMFSMRMTSFSNVRFGFKGTLGESYLNFFIYPLILFLAIFGLPMLIDFVITMMAKDMLEVEDDLLAWSSIVIPALIVISLAFAFYMYALIKKKNATYKINGARYGQGVFTTNLETKKFMVIVLKTLFFSLFVFGGLFLMIGAVVYGTIGVEALMEIKNNMEDPHAVQENMAAMIPIIASVYLGLILGGMVVLAYSITRQRTYIYENSSLDEKITFASTLKAKPLAWVMVSNFILVVVTLGLAFPWAKVRMTRVMVEHTLVDTDAGFYDYITQQQKEESSLGEQIGDAFNVDAGIGF